MVLKYFYLLIAIGIIIPKHELYEKYEKTIHKVISKTFDAQDSNISFVEIPYELGCLKKVKKNSEDIGYLFISEVAACNLGGCNSFEKIKESASSEYFDLLLILDNQKNIKQIKILDYFSDYGYEITSKRYLKKFKGKNICTFSNQNDDIDAISGATISSYALEGSLDLLCQQFEEVISN